MAFIVFFLAKINSQGDAKVCICLYLRFGISMSNAYRRLQHRHKNLFVLWRFQRGLGRMREVLEVRFWEVREVREVSREGVLARPEFQVP